MPDSTDNARRDSEPQAGSLPFFARFLESQDRLERSAGTLKYPSDRDEDVTNKYPSDNDEDNRAVEEVLQASPARPMTLKYPSDRDEIDWFLDAPPDGVGALKASAERAMTLKYPSDRDEIDWSLDN